MDTLYTWNQNCTQAGRQCYPDRNGDVPEGDCTRWTEADARAALDTISKMPYAGPYYWRLEKTLKAFLDIPEPTETED